MPVHRLILWDIDGTLVHAGPAAREAFDLAVAAVLQREVPDHGISMSGKTDPQIALEVMAALAVDDEEARRHLPAVMEGLTRELDAAADTIRERGRVHPGVEELLRRLDERAAVVQSVLTGNLAANAALKVAAFGLERWLDMEIGAYGSDDQDRTRLVPIAIEKASRRYGHSFTPEEVWIIGDTPRDLAAAQAGGARCLLVGTGRYPYDELVKEDADLVLPDLTDVDQVEKLLLS
ncbi:MAG TPA: HAD family hydrolase [Actinomycetota bacterium]|nr:HAD family hydrolase [Actinomycetota bacterium]